jgi:hypothetical protein
MDVERYTYSCLIDNDINNLSSWTDNFYLHQYGRTFKVKNLFWNVKLRDNITGFPLNIFTQTTQDMICYLANSAYTEPINNSFDTFSGTIPIFNGNLAELMFPGLLELETSELHDALFVQITHYNGSANQVHCDHYIHVTIEMVH